MYKEILFSDAVRKKLFEGVEKVAKAVKVTLGPCGRNILIEQQFGPAVTTKDGVTVAKSMLLEDKYENLGVQAVIESASKTNDVSGDGTTTCVVLTEAIYREGIKHLTAGANPMELKSGIDKAVREVVENLKSFATQINDKNEIQQIATIAANGDVEIGAHISEAMEKVGDGGIVTIEESKTTDTSVDIVDGMQFDQGFLSPHFVTDLAKQIVILDNPYILVYEKKITSMKSVLNVLEAVQKTGRPLLVISDDLDNTVLTTLVVNKIRNIFQSCAVKAPSFGIYRKDRLNDIATLTGGKAITEDLGIKLEDVKVEDLGQAKKITVTRDNTTIVEGSGSESNVKARIALVQEQQRTETSEYAQQQLQDRLAKLIGGVAVIRIGATTETELKEKRYRVEDALQATKAAIEEGIVPGGGTAFIKTLEVLEKMLASSDVEYLTDDELMGVKIVRYAIQEPMRQIASNAGKEGTVVVETVKAHYRTDTGVGFGYNARTDKYENLVESGVIDPSKVVRVALENAASVAGLLLTTDAAIVIVKEKEQSNNGMPMMGA